MQTAPRPDATKYISSDGEPSSMRCSPTESETGSKYRPSCFRERLVLDHVERHFLEAPGRSASSSGATAAISRFSLQTNP